MIYIFGVDIGIYEIKGVLVDESGDVVVIVCYVYKMIVL